MQLKLSVQALNALMLALTKALAEEKDIVPILMDWDWAIYDTVDGSRVRASENDDDGLKLELHVLNPPVVELDASLLEEDSFEVEVQEL